MRGPPSSPSRFAFLDLAFWAVLWSDFFWALVWFSSVGAPLVWLSWRFFGLVSWALLWYGFLSAALFWLPRFLGVIFETWLSACVSLPCFSHADLCGRTASAARCTAPLSVIASSLLPVSCQ